MRSQRIGLLLACGAVAALVVIGIVWLSMPRVSAEPIIHDWSLNGPGGRYGITEGYTLAQVSRLEFERHPRTWFWFGPLGRCGIPVRTPVAAFGLMASTIALFGLCFYGIAKLTDR